jgi:hypothetical protein
MLLVCSEIQGVSPEDEQKLETSGSFASTIDLTTPEGQAAAASDRTQLIDIARKADARSVRNAKISAAVAIGSFVIAAVGFAWNYYHTREKD